MYYMHWKPVTRSDISQHRVSMFRNRIKDSVPPRHSMLFQVDDTDDTNGGTDILKQKGRPEERPLFIGITMNPTNF